jgi:hypothetical protein
VTTVRAAPSRPALEEEVKPAKAAARKARKPCRRVPQEPQERLTLSVQLAAMYFVDHLSLRQIAAQVGYSYTMTRELILETGMPLRPLWGWYTGEEDEKHT